MSTTSETPIKIEYRGWIIETETDLWPLGYGYKFKYYQDENIYGAKAIEEAKSDIDYLSEMEAPKQEEPTSVEIMKLENKIAALNIAIQELIDQSSPATVYVLIGIRDEFEQQLKDLKFDHDNFVKEVTKQ